MRKTLIVTFLLIAGVNLFAQSELKIGELNPEYINYLNSQNHNGDTDKPLGYVPPPFVFTTLIPNDLKKPTTLPASYDLRTSDNLTSVKNQGTCGSCWTFATFGQIEATWKKIGLGTFDLSENNLKNKHGFEWGPCEGGNIFLSTAYLARLDGPVLEADDPYGTNGNPTSPTGLTPVAYVNQMRVLPNRNTAASASELRDYLKQYLYDTQLPIYTNMRWEDPSYNSGNKTYYYSGTDGTNHAVLLVGWDDNKVTAGGTGAWIIRNSWGTSWGENGFFYISYNDTRALGENAVWPERININSSSKVYYYDKLSAVGNVGYSDPDAYALVKYVATGNDTLRKLGTYISYAPATVSFEVYDNFSGSVLSTKLGEISSQSIQQAGYHTFDLPSPIALTNGNDFYIKAYYNSPGATHPIPVEMASSGFASPTIESNVAWISNTGTSWSAIGASTSYLWDLCIKAYAGSTGGGSTPEIIELVYDDGTPSSGYYYGTAGYGSANRLTPTINGSKLLEMSIYFTSINAGTASYTPIVLDNSAGTPGDPLVTLSSKTASSVPGWDVTDLSSHNIIVNGDFFVGLIYDGTNRPAFGYDPVNNDRAWDKEANWSSWNETYFMRAKIQTPTSIAEFDNKIPDNFELSQNYPNPFNPTTTIRFSLPTAEKVSLIIYNINGQKIATLVDNELSAGTYNIQWNGKTDSGINASSGVYLYSIQAGAIKQSKAMILLK